MKIKIINGKEPKLIKSTNFKKIINSIFKFFENKDMSLKPYPTIILDCKKQKSLVNFCLGVYSPNPCFSKNEVHIFVKDRAPNDIVRTMFHEFVHHWQHINGNLEKVLKTLTAENSDVGLHDGLTKIEQEANDKGFFLYREWARNHKNVKNPDTQFDSISN